MLLVAEQPGTCPVLKAPGPWDRAMAHIRASALDSALADGASPDGTVRLALRAQRLTGMRERRAMARAIRHLVDDAGDPVARRRRPIPARWERVRATAAEFETVAGRLASQAPVSARGVAQVSMLLRDGYGPLYSPSKPDALATRVHQAAAALDVPGTW